MGIKLVCNQPFHGYVKGQEVTDPAKVAELLVDRDHHFVKVTDPDLPSLPEPDASEKNS